MQKHEVAAILEDIAIRGVDLLDDAIEALFEGQLGDMLNQQLVTPLRLDIEDHDDDQSMYEAFQQLVRRRIFEIYTQGEPLGSDDIEDII